MGLKVGMVKLEEYNMSFNVDLEKIGKVYGDEVLEQIKNNMDEVIKNINYMCQLNFDDVEDIFERETLLFLYDNKTFVRKLNGLIKTLGITYVDDIENDLSLLENLL